MELKMLSRVLSRTILLSLAILCSYCSNSGDKKTAITTPTVSAKDSAAGAVTYHEPAPAPDQTPTPVAVNETGSSRINQNKPPGTSAPAIHPETVKIAETPQTAAAGNGKEKTTGEQAPVAPAKAAETKQEPAASAPQQPAAAPPKAVEAPPAVQANDQAPGSWVVPAQDNNRPNPVKADAESLSTGKSLYSLHCASCHGKSGRGDGTKAARLDTPCGNLTLAGFKSQTDGAILYKIKQGKGDMPGFKKKMPDEDDIWSIVNYIRTFK